MTSDRYPPRLLVRIDLRGEFLRQQDHSYWVRVRSLLLPSFTGHCFWARSDEDYRGHPLIIGTFVTLTRHEILPYLPPHVRMTEEEQLLFKTVYLDHAPSTLRKNVGKRTALIEKGFLHGARPTVYGYNSYFLSIFQLHLEAD